MEVDRESLLILLETGPQTAAQLAEWLERRRIDVARALRAMADAGEVKRVGVEKRWSLAGHVSRPGRKPTRPRQASAVYRQRTREIVERAPAARPVAAAPQTPTYDPRLRQVQPPPPTSRGSFWVGLSREELREASENNAHQMSASRMARLVDPNVRD